MYLFTQELTLSTPEVKYCRCHRTTRYRCYLSFRNELCQRITSPHFIQTVHNTVHPMNYFRNLKFLLLCYMVCNVSSYWEIKKEWTCPISCLTKKLGRTNNQINGSVETGGCKDKMSLLLLQCVTTSLEPTSLVWHKMSLSSDIKSPVWHKCH